MSNSARVHAYATARLYEMINAPIEDANDYDVTGTECDPDFHATDTPEGYLVRIRTSAGWALAIASAGIDHDEA